MPAHRWSGMQPMPGDGLQTRAPEPRDALLAMEPDLRTLQGVLAGCRIFSQSPDPVDPAALAVLADLGGQAAERLFASWRAILSEHPP